MSVARMSGGGGGGRSLDTFQLPHSLLALMHAAGFHSKADLDGMTPIALRRELGESKISFDDAHLVLKTVKHADVVRASIGSLQGSSALEMLKTNRRDKKIFTLNAGVDSLLGGGVAVRELTEFCGVPGIGKTQLGMQLACNTMIPAVLGGLEAAAVYIDTEGSLDPQRMHQIADGLIKHIKRIESPLPEVKAAADKLTAEQIMSSVHVFRVYDYSEQVGCIRSLETFLQEKKESGVPIKLIVIDSVAFHFRGSFNEDWSLKHRLLDAMAKRLLEYSVAHDLAVVLMNQVTTKVTQGGAQMAPALGNKWNVAVTQRVMLKKAEEGTCTAELVKSAKRAHGSASYTITHNGFRAVDNKRSSANNPSNGSSNGSAKRKNPPLPAPTSSSSPTGAANAAAAASSVDASKRVRR
jgi:RAD51-like protein 2